jgi:hypothetical protein
MNACGYMPARIHAFSFLIIVWNSLSTINTDLNTKGLPIRFRLIKILKYSFCLLN